MDDKVPLSEEKKSNEKAGNSEEKLPEFVIPVFNPKDSSDLFKSYFCRNFDTILKINKSQALNLEKQIIDPLVLELGPFINLETLQQSWAAGKTYSTKDKILLNLIVVGRNLKNGVLWLLTVLVRGFMSFFTNQFVIILIETVLAITYVVYSTPSYIIYPIILWIFTNVYPKFDSILGLNLKIWLLMIPTGLNSLMAKRRVNTDLTISTNNDFNFNYKAEYNLIDISTLGVVLMSFVILEMILMANRKANLSSANNLDGSSNVHKVSKTFLMISGNLYNNSIYLIMINVYVIALDINLISLGLIIYFIRLILVRQISSRVYYTLFWYNQVSIVLRYVYNHHKPLNQANEKSSTYNLYKLIGVEESDNMSAKTKLLLNFSLQLLLILIIFNIRNKDIFEKMKQEEDDENTVKMAFSSTSGLKLVFKNIWEFVRFSAFHCLPWIAYIVIYLAMIFTSTSIVTMTEMIFLSYVFVSHLRNSIDQRFGGMHLMRSSWRALVTYCAIMALSRYSLWFIAQPYLKEKSVTVQRMYDFIILKLNFVGLLPKNLTNAYLELLPSFLAMYLGSLVLHRITVVEFAIKNEEAVMQVDIEEADAVPMVGIMRDEEDEFDERRMSNMPSLIDQPANRREERPRVSNLKRSTVLIAQDIRTKLTEKDREERRDKKLKLRARREVIGDINVLQ